VLDRFVDSSLAYQGAARGLGVEEVRAVNAFATGGLVPDLTLLVRVPVGVGRGRQAGRGTGADRLEREDDGFFAAVGAAYDALAEAEPARWRVLDGERGPDEVLEAALGAVLAVR
jgi:dTMP kinase